MNCQNCGNKLKKNQNFCNKCGAKIETGMQQKSVNHNSVTSAQEQKFSTPVILVVSILAGFVFIVLVIGIINFCKYTDISTENNATEQQTEQREAETYPKQPITDTDKLYLLDEYQAKYFKIIRRNDVLLQITNDYNSERDWEELDELFSEVKSKITNQNYLNKYNEIEERFSENLGKNTNDMNTFAAQHYDAVDSLLNEVYQAVKIKIPQEDFKNLVRNEIKWLNDVKNYKTVFDSKDFGSIGTLVNLNYEINMRNFRTLLLMLYL